MSTDQQDQALFDGFELLTPTATASQRALERTRDLLLHRAAACETRAKHRSRLRLLVCSKAREVLFVCLLFVVVLHLSASFAGW